MGNPGMGIHLTPTFKVSEEPVHVTFRVTGADSYGLGSMDWAGWPMPGIIACREAKNLVRDGSKYSEVRARSALAT